MLSMFRACSDPELDQSSVRMAGGHGPGERLMPIELLEVTQPTLEIRL